MKRKEITDFLHALLGRRPEYKVVNGWVSTACPLAPWTHVRGGDQHPSFGVTIQEKGENVSIFNCYTCKKKGTLSRLATMYQEFSGKDCSHLIDEAEDIELFGAQLPLWEDLDNTEPHLTPPEPLGKEYHDLFGPAYNVDPFRARRPLASSHPYLIRRGITARTAHTLQIKYDPADSQGDARIVFQVRGPREELYGYTGRAIQESVVPRVRDYYGLPKRACILGIEFVVLRGCEKIVLVEGLFDYAKLQQYGIHGVAAMHSGLTELQARLLRDLGKPVVLMYDNDQAGRLGNKQAKKLLEGYVPLEKVRYPDNVKDPGDLSHEQAWWMVRNTRVA